MRPVTVTAGPFAAAAATAIATAQTAAAAGDLAINGTQATAGWIGTASLTGQVFTATVNTQGQIAGGFPFPVLSGLGVLPGTVVLGPGPGVSAAGTPGGLSWTVNIAQTLGSRTMYTNAVAKSAVPAQVTLTTSGADAGVLATLVGTDWAGEAITEVVTLVGTGTANSVLSYATVTQVSLNSATVGTVSAGFAQQGSSPWVRLDDFAPGPVSITCAITGTITYSVQQTNQDPNDPTNPVAPQSLAWLPSPDAASQGAVVSIQTVLANAPRFVRVITTAGAGSVSMTVAQQGAVPY